MPTDSERLNTSPRGLAGLDPILQGLQQSDDRDRALAQAAGHIVWTVTPDGRLGRTDAWCAYTGRQPHELAGRGALAPIHPDDRHRILAAWLRARRAGAPYSARFRLRRYDGVYRPFLARGVPVRDPDGSIREWAGFAIDIGELPEAEPPNGQLPGPLFEIMDLANRGAGAATGAGHAARRAAVERTGPRQPTVAPPASDPGTVVQDLGARTARPADGQPRQGPSGNVVRDLGARTAARERDRLRQVLDVLPVAALICDATPIFVLCNRPARDLLGGDVTGLPVPMVADEALPVASAWRPDGRPFPVEDLPLQRALRRNEEVRGEQVIMRHPVSGLDVPVLADAVPLRDATGAVTGAVAVFQDITALQALEQAREVFLASAAHDLKNPLTAITGHLQLARRRLARLGLAEQQQASLAGALQGIQEASDWLLAQINGLLDVARLQMGVQLELQRRPTDLVELVRTVVAHQQGGLPGRVVVESDSDALVATIDGPRIERVVANLLSNATKYGPPEEKVTVQLSREGLGGEQWATLAVRDRGLGIPAADLPYVFDRFRRGANVAGRIGGTGLGLASVRQIVEAHGGTVVLESREGEGTTAIVRLPLEAPESD